MNENEIETAVRLIRRALGDHHHAVTGDEQEVRRPHVQADGARTLFGSTDGQTYLEVTVRRVRRGFE